MDRLRQIEAAFTAWAQANDDIRAAFVLGSRARTDHPADEWADLDVVLFARNVERYQNATDWIAALAPIWIALPGRTVADDPERLVLFEGGLQVDFVFHGTDLLAQVPQVVRSGDTPEAILRGTRVLLDKDGTLAQLPPPSRLPAGQPPDAETFRQALDGFWFSAAYCARQLRRGELWAFENGSAGMLRPLLQVIEWHVRADGGWDTDTWHDGKFIAEWANADVCADLRRVFARFDADDGWRAMQARLALFHRLARQVAGRLDLDYPSALEAQIAAYVDELHRGAHAVSPDQVFHLPKQVVTLHDFPAAGPILDVGGGGEGIVGLLKPGQAIAIDRSRRELQEAAPGALKVVMDARELQFLDGAFDTATACFSLMFVQEADQRRVLEEVFRVLAPGGRLLVWDAHLPPRPADVPPERTVVAFDLTVHLPQGTIQTGYGARWPPRDHDMGYYTRLAQAVGFEVTAQQQQGRVLYIELRKPA